MNSSRFAALKKLLHTRNVQRILPNQSGICDTLQKYFEKDCFKRMPLQTVSSSQESEHSTSESRELLQTVGNIVTKLKSKSEAAVGACLNEVRCVAFDVL
jgi:hypothetical protein